MRLFKTVGIALAALSSIASRTAGQTFGCSTGGAGGPIPALGTGGGGTFPWVEPPNPAVFPLVVTSIPSGAVSVTAVNLNGLSHSYAEDLSFSLEDPAGQRYNLWCRTGGSCWFTGGNYVVSPTSCSILGHCGSPSPIAPGTYGQFLNTCQNVLNGSLLGVSPQVGTWNLYVHDWAVGDLGALGSWDLCFGGSMGPPPCSIPYPTSPPFGAQLSGPYIQLEWYWISVATSYDVTIDGVTFNVPTNSMEYVSSIGQHAWSVRAVNAGGAGPSSPSWMFVDIGPQKYCTAGTSTHGCVPVISADSHPSASQAHPTYIQVTGLEGQTSGLSLYGLRPNGVPWSTSSSSYLCVKAPTQRTGVQSTGGASGICSGWMVLDFGAWLNAHPGALGAPFVARDEVFFQAWYRDPPAPTSTNLSAAISAIYAP